MPCFPGTTLAHIIANSFRRIDSCSTLSYLNPKALHTSFILIGLYHQTEKCYPPIHKEKSLLKHFSCGPYIEMDSPGPSNEYNGWPNSVDTLGFMNLSTMSPLVLPQDLSNLVANDVYKLSMVNSYWGGSFQFFLFYALGEQILGPDLSLYLTLLFYLGTLIIPLGLRVRSLKRYDLEPHLILFSAS